MGNLAVILFQGLFGLPGTGGIVAGGLGVIATIAGGLFGLFGGAVASNIKAALEGLRQAIIDGLGVLRDFGIAIAQALGKVWGAAHDAWERVIKPIGGTLWKLLKRVRDLWGKFLVPLLTWLAKLRRWILDLYVRYLRPLIYILQRMRQITAILRALHVPGAARIDALLGRIQGKLLAPMLYVLRVSALFGPWMNLLLRADLILQLPIWLRSLVAYQGSATNLWYDSQTRPLTASELADSAADAVSPPAGYGLAAFQAESTSGAGPMMDRYNAARGRMD